MSLSTLFREGFVCMQASTQPVCFFRVITFINLPNAAALNRWPLVTFLIGKVGGMAITRNTARLWVCQLWPELLALFKQLITIGYDGRYCFFIALHLVRKQTFVLIACNLLSVWSAGNPCTSTCIRLHKFVINLQALITCTCWSLVVRFQSHLARPDWCTRSAWVRRRGYLLTEGRSAPLPSTLRWSQCKSFPK